MFNGLGHHTKCLRLKNEIGTVFIKSPHEPLCGYQSQVKLGLLEVTSGSLQQQAVLISSSLGCRNSCRNSELFSLTTNMSRYAHPQANEVHLGKETHRGWVHEQNAHKFHVVGMLRCQVSCSPTMARDLQEQPLCSLFSCSLLRSPQTAFSFPIPCGSAGLNLGRTSIVTLSTHAMAFPSGKTNEASYMFILGFMGNIS